MSDGWGTSWAKPEWLNDVKDIVKAKIVKEEPTNAQVTTEVRTRNNKVPTHDPYTNPNAYIYFECSCGAILDPSTKSFAALTTAASKANWKIRFGHQWYMAYCVECGKDVE